VTFVVPSKSQKEFLASATAQYAADLAVHAAAQAWLMKRGLSEDSARSFQLGVVVSPLPSHEQYRGRLAIPYLTLSGVCGMAFRCIEHEDCKPVHSDKYLWPSGYGRRIFNTRALDIPSSFIAICEGEIDPIISTQCGVPSVGVPGATQWQKYWARCFKGYDVVYVLQDDDDAGEKLTAAICRDIPAARPIVMTDGDVNEFYLSHGAEALLARIGAR
jgi:DNA primase